MAPKKPGLCGGVAACSAAVSLGADDGGSGVVGVIERSAAVSLGLVATGNCAGPIGKPPPEVGVTVVPPTACTSTGVASAVVAGVRAPPAVWFEVGAPDWPPLRSFDVALPAASASWAQLSD